VSRRLHPSDGSSAGLASSLWHRLGPAVRWLVTHQRWVPWLVVVAVGLGLAIDAEARVGGGQRYSRPSRGGGYSGGGGGSDADIIFLLIHLIIEVPIIGVPLTLAFLFFVVVRFWFGRSSGRVVHRTTERSRATGGRRRRPPVVKGLAKLRKVDEGFSMPVFLDFAILVHRRALEALSTGRFEPMAPFLSDHARKQLVANHEGVERVDDVVVGGVRISEVSWRSGYTVAEVIYEDTRTETTDGGATREVIVHERWLFRRKADAVSLPPEEMMAMTCPSCGAAIETDSVGACSACDTPITKGQLQWQVHGVEVGHRGRVVAPEVGFVAGGDEASVDVPTVHDRDLQAAVRRLLARHPELSMDDFSQRVSLVYHRLQAAWSAGEWDDARPYVTDSQYQSLRYWMDRYKKYGLANRLEDVELERVTVVKVDIDAWYESITVRLWGSMRDYIEEVETGKVVGGNQRKARRFSEYWTFLRAGGTDGTTRGDTDACPSCGAPLDNISQAGICGYCDSKITSGQFDWVLARIEQPEAYGG